MNSGTLNKNLAGLSDLGNRFTNAATGTVNVAAGTLRLPEAITQNGAITIAEGATLDTAGQSFANSAGANLGGAGTLDLGAGTLLNTGTLRPGQVGPVPGTLAILGNLSLGASTIAGPGALTVSGSTGITGASTLTSTLTTNGFTLPSGSLTVGATGVLDLTGAGTGARTIAGGTLSSSGTVEIGGDRDVTLSDGALWDNFGAVNLGGGSRIVLGGAGAATLINRGAGRHSRAPRAPRRRSRLAGAPAAGKAFANAGRLIKAVGSASVQTLDVPMTNTGRIDVLARNARRDEFPVQQRHHRPRRRNDVLDGGRGAHQQRR